MASEMDSQRPSGASADMQRNVDDITRMLGELRLAQNTIRRRIGLGTLLILVILLGFGAASYYKLRANFTADKIQQATAMRVSLLVPQLQIPINATLRDVLPFYVEMGRERFQRLAPKLDASVRDQANRLGAELERKMNAQLDACFGRLNVNLAGQLAEKFPALVGDGGAKAATRLHQVMTDEEAKLLSSTQALYNTESQRVADALARFPKPDVTQTDLDTLHRQLLHELLMFADNEMTSSGQGLATAAAAPAR